MSSHDDDTIRDSYDKNGNDLNASVRSSSTSNSRSEEEDEDSLSRQQTVTHSNNIKVAPSSRTRNDYASRLARKMENQRNSNEGQTQVNGDESRNSSNNNDLGIRSSSSSSSAPSHRTSVRSSDYASRLARKMENQPNSDKSRTQADDDESRNSAKNNDLGNISSSSSAPSRSSVRSSDYASRLARKMERPTTGVSRKNSDEGLNPMPSPPPRSISNNSVYRYNLENESVDVIPNVNSEQDSDIEDYKPDASLESNCLTNECVDLNNSNGSNQSNDENEHTIVDRPTSRVTFALDDDEEDDDHDCDNNEARPGAYQSNVRANGMNYRFARAISSRWQTNTVRWSTISTRIRSIVPGNNDNEPVQVVAVAVDEDDLANRTENIENIENEIRQNIIENSAVAEVVQPINESKSKIVKYAICLVILVLLALTVGLSVGLTRERDPSDETETPTLSPTEPHRPLLDTLPEEGKLRCGIGWYGIGYYEHSSGDGKTLYGGIEVELCRAVAAAVFNERDNVDIVVVSWTERWEALANRSIDLLTLASTHTSQRDVYQKSVDRGFSFSIPYLYDGIAFGGDPKFVDCADNLDAYFFDCRATSVCTPIGSTYDESVRDLLPDKNIISVPNNKLYENLIVGRCNVIASDSLSIAESLVRKEGYDEMRNYSIGTNRFSKEPLCMVTRDDDPQWSDFVNAILRGLLSAEAQNITKATSDNFATTNVFGDKYKYMFKNAIGAIGNYAELYNHTLSAIAPRSGLNMLNTGGDSGLIFSHPFGSISNDGPGPTYGGTLDSILQRGYLRCGITSRRAGFVEKNSKTNVWNGLDVDYCRALSASCFGDNSKNKTVEFVELSATSEEFLALSNKTVDALAGANFNLLTDVNETTTGEGFTFSQPYFYHSSPDGAEVQLTALATRQDDPQWSDFVYQVVASLIYAEEEAIAMESSYKMPEVGLFGPVFKDMFRSAISAVGNYGEIYARNVESLYPRKGTMNDLNTNPFGPQHYAFPM